MLIQIHGYPSASSEISICLLVVSIYILWEAIGPKRLIILQIVLGSQHCPIQCIAVPLYCSIIPLYLIKTHYITIFSGQIPILQLEIPILSLHPKFF